MNLAAFAQTQAERFGSQVHEACLQLRGQADGRQVPNAHVAAVSAGAGPLASCLLLRTE